MKKYGDNQASAKTTMLSMLLQHGIAMSDLQLETSPRRTPTPSPTPTPMVSLEALDVQLRPGIGYADGRVEFAGTIVNTDKHWVATDIGLIMLLRDGSGRVIREDPVSLDRTTLRPGEVMYWKYVLPAAISPRVKDLLPARKSSWTAP
ncbi:MAG: hypothetical protein HY675_17885 [Chloroflexi bacterium]|nr:hypothetical protein [Chloroflexota bacterium]